MSRVVKVSIITTCFNRKDTIKDAIESVIMQDYPNIEYIVIDGASTDGTLDVINQYRCNISHIISEPDSGMYEAVNKGIRIATGEIIGLVHSDDMLYDKNVISNIVNEMETLNADFLYGNGVFVSKDDENRVIRRWRGGRYSSNKVRFGWLPLHTTCYIKNDILKCYGLYNENYKIAADSDLLVRYLLPGKLKVVYYNNYIIRMRMGGLSTDPNKRKQMWDEDVKMYASHGLPPVRTKLLKMFWKIPQFFFAFFIYRL